MSETKHQFLKQFEETMENDQSQNGRGEYQTDEITYAKGGFTVNG